MSQLRVGGGIAGAFVTIGSLLIFLIGIPVLRYMLPAAILLGCGVALVFRFIRHDTPGAPWLLSAIERKTEPATEPEDNGSSGRSQRILQENPATS